MSNTQTNITPKTSTITSMEEAKRKFSEAYAILVDVQNYFCPLDSDQLAPIGGGFYMAFDSEMLDRDHVELADGHKKNSVCFIQTCTSLLQLAVASEIKKDLF